MPVDRTVELMQSRAYEATLGPWVIDGVTQDLSAALEIEFEVRTRPGDGDLMVRGSLTGGEIVVNGTETATLTLVDADTADLESDGFHEIAITMSVGSRTPLQTGRCRRLVGVLT